VQNCNICLDSTKVEEEVRERKNKVSVLKSQEEKKRKVLMRFTEKQCREREGEKGNY